MPAPAEPLHLLIADAARPPDAPPPPWPALPQLQALLGRMRLQHTIEADEDSPATPFELALARAHGLPGAPGHIPWAAFETGTVGTPQRSVAALQTASTSSPISAVTQVE